MKFKIERERELINNKKNISHAGYNSYIFISIKKMSEKSNINWVILAG